MLDLVKVKRRLFVMAWLALIIMDVVSICVDLHRGHTGCALIDFGWLVVAVLFLVATTAEAGRPPTENRAG